jgi:hypothetical protein
MEKPVTSHSAQVYVFPVAGEWQVSIEENGSEAVVHFLVEEHARSFAALQRRRLKLSPIPRRQTLEGEAGIIATSAM